MKKTLEEFLDFLKKRMRPSHIYQPVMIETLIDCDGSASLIEKFRPFSDADIFLSSNRYEQKRTQFGRIAVRIDQGIPGRERGHRTDKGKNEYETGGLPEIYRALGELAVEATLLESELTMILCQLVIGPITDPKSVNVEVVNAVASERRSFPQLANFVRRIFNAHIRAGLRTVQV